MCQWLHQGYILCYFIIILPNARKIIGNLYCKYKYRYISEILLIYKQNYWY